MQQAFYYLGVSIVLGLALLGAVELRNRIVVAERIRPVVQHGSIDYADLR